MAIQTKEMHNGAFQDISALIAQGVRRIAIDRAWNGPGYMAYSLEKDGCIGLTITDKAYPTVKALRADIIATFGPVQIGRI